MPLSAKPMFSWWENIECSGQRSGRCMTAEAIESLRNMTNLKKAEEHIIKMSEELQQRVAERTAGLTKANKALEAEIKEHKKY